MTPAQRSLIERAIAQPDLFYITANMHEAISAMRLDLETAEARVEVLERAVRTWEHIHDKPGYDPGMDHFKQAIEPDSHPTAERQ